MDLIQNIEKSYIKEDLPTFKSGDTVKVNVKVVVVPSPVNNCEPS